MHVIHVYEVLKFNQASSFEWNTLASGLVSTWTNFDFQSRKAGRRPNRLQHSIGLYTNPTFDLSILLILFIEILRFPPKPYFTLSPYNFTVAQNNTQMMQMKNHKLNGCGIRFSRFDSFYVHFFVYQNAHFIFVCVMFYHLSNCLSRLLHLLHILPRR